jgi:hypothetical protein
MTPNSQSNLPLGNGATPLFADPFTGATAIENKWIVLKGGAAGTKNPGLTAGTSTTFPTSPTGGLPGFGGTADTAGQGVLRLTDNTTSQAAAVIYNQEIFSKAGVSIEFDYYQYGGTVNGDGLSFFLIDGTTASPTAGGFGGSLGYANSTVNGTTQAGAAGGYLGVGFDAFGNFSNPTEGRTGGPGATSDVVAVRGSQSTGYKYLTQSGAIAGGIDNNAAGATRNEASRRRVQIELSGTGVLNVRFDLNKDGDFVDSGETVITNYDTITTGGNAALPTSVKFGFSASSGDATNFHEIRNLAISSVADLFTGGGGTVNHTASTVSVAIAPALTVNTVVVPTPTSTFNGATVGITPATYKTGQDFLTVGTVTANAPAVSGTFTNGLTWAFNATTGVLTVSGAGTPAQYQDALKQVSYYNNAGATAITTDRTAQYILTGIAGTPSTTAIITVGAGNSAAKRPEILFQNASGEVALWTVDTKGALTGAKFVTFGAGFGTALVGKNLVVPAGWKVIDTGDVDKDGVADILWFNPNTQETAIHFMTNDGVLKAGDFIRTSATAPTLKVAVADQWSPVGLTDVTGDGILDITWRAAATDLIAYWTVAGTTSTVLTSGGYLQTTAGTADFKTGDNSRGVKMGDFDGDGKATDMLLSNGKVVFVGAFTGGKLLAKGSAQLPSNGDTSLVVKAVGDYNVDGTTDLAWESSTADKQVLEYLKVTTGAFDPAAANFKNLPQTGANWLLGASKDFNADVTSDLVWYNTSTGEVAIWAIDKLAGGLVTDGSTAYVTFNGARLKTPAGWSVVGADDFGTLPALV